MASSLDSPEIRAVVDTLERYQDILATSPKEAIKQEDIQEIRKWLEAVREIQSNPGDAPNPVYDGFGCVKNCKNETGYVDVVIGGEP